MFFRRARAFCPPPYRPMVQSKPRISSKILGQPLPQRRPRHRSSKILGQPLSQGDLAYHFVDHASMVRWIFVLPDAELFDQVFCKV